MANPVAVYNFLFAAFAFVFGAAVGSFLNVCIYRLPRDLSVNEPSRSFCPSCKKQIPWHQNIPLVSWLFLRGRCANCGSRIAFRYFAVELLTALLFLACYETFGLTLEALKWAIFSAIMIVLVFTDLRERILPDVINYERFGFSPDTIKELQRRGHTLREGGGQGAAQVIIYDAKEDMLDGGSDRRASDGGAVGVPGRTAARPATAQR